MRVRPGSGPFTARRESSRLARFVAVLSVMSLLGGCSSIIDNAVDDVATNLTRSMMDQDDPETVRQAAPAYLLMLDSFVQGDPDNPSMLYNTAALYSAYGGVFVDDPVRAQKAYSTCVELRPASAVYRLLGCLRHYVHYV